MEFAIGIPSIKLSNSQTDTYYASLGYFVRVEKSVVASDTSKKVTEFYFPFISDLLKSENSKHEISSDNTNVVNNI